VTLGALLDHHELRTVSISKESTNTGSNSTDWRW